MAFSFDGLLFESAKAKKPKPQDPRHSADDAIHIVQKVQRIHQAHHPEQHQWNADKHVAKHLLPAQ